MQTGVIGIEEKNDNRVEHEKGNFVDRKEMSNSVGKNYIKFPHLAGFEFKKKENRFIYTNKLKMNANSHIMIC